MTRHRLRAKSFTAPRSDSVFDMHAPPCRNISALSRNSRQNTLQFHQTFSDTQKHFCPIAHRFLAIKLGSRIPRAIGAFGLPAPVWTQRQEHPDRFAQGAGEMDGGSVDRDYQI